MKNVKRVLLVEDDPNDVELILDALSTNKMINEIVHARDGVEALDYLYFRGKFAERPAGDPVVVLLDLKMPRMGGLEVLKELKNDQKMRMIPVVILTSSRESTDLEECYRLGVNAYVVKPVSFNEFADAVAKTGVFWALINQTSGNSKKQ